MADSPPAASNLSLLKLVVDREKEIEAFIPVEYWNIYSILQTKKDEHPFSATFYSVDGKRVEKEPSDGKDVFTDPERKNGR